MVRFRDTLYAARMARDLLWESGKAVKLDEFVAISQTYVSHLVRRHITNILPCLLGW